MSNPCICGLKKTFDKCCGRFLTAGLLPKTPEQLMRSRYTAYSLGGYGDYLLSTWFAATAGALTAEALSQTTVDWLSLEVLTSQQSGDKATVEFKARYVDVDVDKANIQTLHEVSVFQRTKGRWLYVGGEISTQAP